MAKIVNHDAGHKGRKNRVHDLFRGFLDGTFAQSHQIFRNTSTITRDGNTDISVIVSISIGQFVVF